MQDVEVWLCSQRLVLQLEPSGCSTATADAMDQQRGISVAVSGGRVCKDRSMLRSEMARSFLREGM